MSGLMEVAEAAANSNKTQMQRHRLLDSVQGMKTKVRCSKCKQDKASRVARVGFLRRRVYSLFGFYPWECGICRSQFLARKRGGSYRKSSKARTPSGYTPGIEGESAD